MDNDTKRAQALRVLELEDSSTWSDIEQAYQRLLARYSSQSLASYGLLRQSERHKLLEAIGKAYLRLSQMRYKTKPPGSSPPSTPPPGFSSFGNPGGNSGVSSLAPEKRTGPAPIETPDSYSKPSGGSNSNAPRAMLSVQSAVAMKAATKVVEPSPSQGGILWKARASIQMSLQDVAQRTHHSYEMLARLEQRDYQDFESSRQLRSVVEAVAAAVGLNRQQAITEVLSDFWKWRANGRKSN